jgi:rSAM/selenodomain-associated transferase 1
MHPGTLVVMTRHPIPGACKTRLIPVLGAQGAAELAAAFLDDLLERFGGFPIETRILAWTGGDKAAPACPGFRPHPQGEGDLGERLVRLYGAFRPPVVFIGSDAPTLPTASLEGCLEALEGAADVVIQPALDGGFTMAGLKRDPEPLFAGVPWGTARVLDTVLRQAETLAVEVNLLEPWYDVDVPADLERLRAHLPALVGKEAYAARTAAVLERILETKT